MRLSEPLHRVIVLLDDQRLGALGQWVEADFRALHQSRSPVLVARAGTAAEAVYATLGPGLLVQELVFFLLPLDAAGAIDAQFNIPLEYLAQHAGEREDLGLPGLRAASRAQCPVPWMALRLWEPESGTETEARRVQRLLLTNRLGLDSRRPSRGSAPVDAALGPAAPGIFVRNKPDLVLLEALQAAARSDRAETPLDADRRAGAGIPGAGSAGESLDRAWSPDGYPVPVTGAARVAPTDHAAGFGPTRAGRAYARTARRESMDAPDALMGYTPPEASVGWHAATPQRAPRVIALGELPRDEYGAIEESYLEQIRRFRTEILELKAALRLERERNRRLQALLRQ